MTKSKKTSNSTTTKSTVALLRAEMKKDKDYASEKKKKKLLYENKTWYTIRALLGHQWWNWAFLIGARQRGKTYSVQEYCLRCFFNPKHKLYHVPFYWMRLNDIAIKNMLMNRAAKCFEPLLVRQFGLYNLRVSGDSIFLADGTLLCRVYGLSTAYNNKGAAMFDAKNFNGVNIILDECALEKGQRRTVDLAYNLQMNIENICRNARQNVKVFCMLNNTEEAPEILTAVAKFIPLEFGVYKLKRRHCIIDYIPNTEGYEKMRKNALATDIDTSNGNFTNKVARDIKLLYKGRLGKPQMIVKYSKYQSDWFCIYEGNVVCPYNGENKTSVAMKRYIDDTFLPELRDNIIEQEDVRAFKYKDIYTQTLWRKNMELIKK